jgi:hypothetical protein
MLSRTSVKPKLKSEVELVFKDGSSIRGAFFLTPDQRIVDALNDERSFVPFEDSDGELIVVRKDAVRYLKPKSQTIGRRDEAPRYIGHS